MGQVAGAGLIASYSRDQERQADEIGQDLEAASGWDPEGLADLLGSLERESKLETGKARKASFLDSHPQPGERAVVARGRAAQLPRGPESRIAKSRAAFLQRVEGVVVGTNPDEGVFRDNVFLHPGLGFAVTFPSKWVTKNSKQAVAAASQRRDAVILLESQGATENPQTAAQRWVRANGIQLADSEALRIGGWPAYRGAALAQTKSGVVALDVTWIAHPSGTYRLTALTSPSSFRNWEPTFERTATSFRALSSAERANAKPLRLRIATARAGESLEALGARTGNRWSVAETAVANALSKDARLAAGQLVKIAAE
jgi:predicted Zn-dependent protease